jgi:hypothetical protein
VDKRIATNALNFILSKRFTYTGEDFLPLVEVVRELQAIVDGRTTNQESGPPED